VTAKRSTSKAALSLLLTLAVLQVLVGGLRAQSVVAGVSQGHYRIGQDNPLAQMTYYAGIDEPAPAIPRSTNFRGRFQIVNGSGQQFSWQPLLEWSQAPDSGYAPVPTTPGTAPFFVADTDQFSNGDTIAREHFGCGYRYASTGGSGSGGIVGYGYGYGVVAGGGEVVESAQTGKAYDAENPAASTITLAANSYTEIEFNIQANGNAADATDYYFRLTNQGTPLDSYEQVAQITIRTPVVTFSRQLSGERTGQHKAAPLVEVNVRITASVDEAVTSARLADLFPSSWQVTQAQGGSVSTVDGATKKIEWQVGDILAGGSVTREYTLFSPQRTIPPTKYYFHSQLSYDGGSASSDPWKVIVSDPTPEYLYGTAQNATDDRGNPLTINNAANSIDAAFNDAVANAQAKWFDVDASWTFTAIQDTSTSPSSVNAEFRFYQSGWSNDSFDVEVYDGTTWTTVDTFSPSNAPPSTLTTKTYDVSTTLDTTAKINAAQMRFVGKGTKSGGADNFTMYVDEVRLAVTGVATGPTLKQEHYRIGQDTALNAMTYYAATDTAATGIPRNTNFRVRFQVYNDGADPKSWQPRLDWSATSGSGYAAVPTTSGADPFFVADTTQFTNGATISTTYFGLGTGTGTAVDGYAYDTENPPASAISLAANSYTEIEFNLQANGNAADASDYYFRLTNQGTPLDSYDKVARITIRTPGVTFSRHLSGERTGQHTTVGGGQCPDNGHGG
jgi:hypothetical protein